MNDNVKHYVSSSWMSLPATLVGECHAIQSAVLVSDIRTQTGNTHEFSTLVITTNMDQEIFSYRPDLAKVLHSGAPTSTSCESAHTLMTRCRQRTVRRCTWCLAHARKRTGECLGLVQTTERASFALQMAPINIFAKHALHDTYHAPKDSKGSTRKVP